MAQAKKTKTVTREEKVEAKHHMKRWEIYTLIALIVLVIGAGIYGAYYYVEHVMNEPKIESDLNVERTAEEEELDQLKADIENDSALDLDDVDAELKDLEAIDISGV